MNPAEEYILNQPEPYKSILLHLQVVIESTVPNVDLKYKYRIPFYYVEGRPLCYMNASHKKKFVDLGFWNAAHLTVHPEHMVMEGRKMMKSLRYVSITCINDKILIDVLQEAYKVRHNKFWDGTPN